VASITALAFHLHLSFAPAVFLLLLLRLGQSLSGRFAASAAVSLLAAGAWTTSSSTRSFIPDQQSARHFGSGIFLITGLVIKKLVTRLRLPTGFSRRRQERMRRLYHLAQTAARPGAESERSSGFLELFCGTFSIRAVCLFSWDRRGVYTAPETQAMLSRRRQPKPSSAIRTMRTASAESQRNAFESAAGPLRRSGFEGLEDPDLTAGPLAALAAAHLERTRSFAQTESYRSAILDARAHEFKTPLSTILTAGGALREAPSLGPRHRELAEPSNQRLRD